jgi:hypothetical protein
MIQYIIAAGLGALVGSAQRKGKKFAMGGTTGDAEERAFAEYMEDYGVDREEADEQFLGEFDNKEQWAAEYVDDIGGIEQFADPERYLEIDYTGFKEFAMNQAEALSMDLEDYDIEKIAKRHGLAFEYMEAEGRGGVEMENFRARMEEKEYEDSLASIMDEGESVEGVLDLIARYVGGGVEEAIDQHVVEVDYVEVADALEGDGFEFIEKDFKTFVFNSNMARGGKTKGSDHDQMQALKKGDKIRITRLTDNRRTETPILLTLVRKGRVNKGKRNEQSKFKFENESGQTFFAYQRDGEEPRFAFSDMAIIVSDKIDFSPNMARGGVTELATETLKKWNEAHSENQFNRKVEKNQAFNAFKKANNVDVKADQRVAKVFVDGDEVGFALLISDTTGKPLKRLKFISSMAHGGKTQGYDGNSTAIPITGSLEGVDVKKVFEEGSAYHDFHEYTREEKDAIKKSEGSESDAYNAITLPKNFPWQTAEIISSVDPFEFITESTGWLVENGYDPKKYALWVHPKFGKNPKLLTNLISQNDESYFDVVFLVEISKDEKEYLERSNPFRSSYYAEGGKTPVLDADEVLDHFIMAMLFAESDEEGTPLDENYSFDDVNMFTLGNARDLIQKFLHENANVIEKHNLSASFVGHDLWMSPTGQGVGFRDRHRDHPTLTKEEGDALHESSEKIMGTSMYAIVEPYDGSVEIDGFPSRFAKGGKTQGYDDKLDESLGSRKGAGRTKKQSRKDRRDESAAMEKSMGRRKYASVGTMDKGRRSMEKGGLAINFDEDYSNKAEIEDLLMYKTYMRDNEYLTDYGDSFYVYSDDISPSGVRDLYESIIEAGYDENVELEFFGKGGKTQGYDDKLDESLGSRKGAGRTKEQSRKDRRDESAAMEKSMGRRKYASVGTMDKGSREMEKGGRITAPQPILDGKEFIALVVDKDGMPQMKFSKTFNGALRMAKNMTKKFDTGAYHVKKFDPFYGASFLEAGLFIEPTKSFGKGGKTKKRKEVSDFDKLAMKVAARYRAEGKSNKEAMEIGRGTAANVARQQQAKKGKK